MPIQTRYPLPNVQFEIHDVNTNFRWQDGTFDLVNARAINMAVSFTHVVARCNLTSFTGSRFSPSLRGGRSCSASWRLALIIRMEPIPSVSPILGPHSIYSRPSILPARRRHSWGIPLHPRFAVNCNGGAFYPCRHRIFLGHLAKPTLYPRRRMAHRPLSPQNRNNVS